MATFQIKVGDTEPSIQATLKGASGAAINLTGASVKLLLQHRITGAWLSFVCTLVTPTEGIVRYDWLTTDVTQSGRWDAEFEVTFAGGAIQTVPNGDGEYFTFVVTEDLN